MSKRALKKYLSEIDKEELEIQLLSLYEKFQPVKIYYDFVFNPKESELVRACKLKISNEYFPVKGKRPKARRSVAQKYIKHYQTLGVASDYIADIMCFAIEIAQTYSAEKPIKQEVFCKSMYTSFEQMVRFCINQGLFESYQSRISTIQQQTSEQNWYNQTHFEELLDSSFF